MTYTESARAQLDALQVKDHVRILALETSCDETAAAIIEDGKILLVKEMDGRYSMPGGWVDVNKTVGENAVRLTSTRSMAASCRKSPAVRTSKPATV